mgnify:CR=1 FL=1
MHLKKPEWVRVKMQRGTVSNKVNSLISDLSLNTVCNEANCPNRMECYERGTATFMILGRNCTRNCTFCNVTREMPDKVNPIEPQNVAKAIEKLGLKHAVITSVTRDDLKDQGANQFAKVVKEIRKATPKVTIELLIPDMQGNKELIDIILNTEPNILNHNVETVPELYYKIRPMAIFNRSIELLHHVKKTKPEIKTKSGIMLGLGETKDQVINVFKRLREVQCDILTLGQYLQPTPSHIPVAEYIKPEQFDEYKEIGLSMGFKRVASAPLVRSSYYAEDF